MTIPFWDNVTEGYEGTLFPSEQPWDNCTLNGQRLPGVSTVTCEPRMKLDIKKPNGADGAPIIVRGHEPAKVTIEVKVWTPAQWTELQKILDDVWRKPGQTSKNDRKASTGAVKGTAAVSIDHPACALYGIASIVMQSPSSPQPAPESGARVVRLQAVQYTPPKAKSVTRKADGAGKVPIAKEFEQARNVAGRKPSETQATPKAPVPPASGSF